MRHEHEPGASPSTSTSTSTIHEHEGDRTGTAIVSYASYSTCPRCSRVYRHGDNYCAGCGKSLQRTCSHCKQILPERQP
jgi:RNA polymerase subunit RPABC4/transcription elongation factor Spt4